ncbi:DoxX family protein [Microbacterium sp.]|uniref:DoxX family protein n=1 Tax=Microbacterium sp. TaxID=51671 RepID=UPI001ACD7D05|nr:DoxX family protein [Microbacterium sp.]MBN9170140.1 DoxX family protein [Microbacterium sp.]MBN9185252.1 DoxX family protein [Microbacterium sp.]MBN9189102.1 DoxX family protein [Microbacterium sp.]MBN9194365.1 DoxX family protein [Microbacterium sp.]
MLVALWIVNALLALAFVATGLLKLVRSKAQLKEMGLGWTDDYSPAVIRTIGVAELIGAAGLILPLATGIAVILAPIAAVCLAVLMVGAIPAHRRHGESFAPPLVLLVLAIASAVLGFVVAL